MSVDLKNINTLFTFTLYYRFFPPPAVKISTLGVMDLTSLVEGLIIFFKYAVSFNSISEEVKKKIFKDYTITY